MPATPDARPSFDDRLDAAASQALRAAIKTMRSSTRSEVRRINEQLWEVWPDGRRKLLLR